jgi:predicted AlkP superfamily phosphohydrolase/phosphomutase
MQTLILGLDAFDPTIFERLSEQGRLPNLTHYAEMGGYARFAVTNPPQSEVSWTSIATGLNPGGHGLFDFVYRDPRTYTLSVSLLPTKRGFAGIQFVPPHSAHTIFDQAVRQGFPATVLWWPATFPARPESPVCTLPGLGTPDIQGKLGVGTLFSTDAGLTQEERKTSVVTLNRCGKYQYTGLLSGPVQKKSRDTTESALKLRLDLIDDKSARLTIGKHSIQLVEGRWSPILELSFKLGRFLSVRALTRVILSQVQPDLKLYFLPLQLHPLHSPWRYATSRAFVKQTWKACGPFLTLGWPQDTTGLEEQCITDSQFLDLCESILSTREHILMHRLQRFHEGILASVFDSLDRVQHMFWRDRPDVVEEWYVKLDNLVGRVKERLAELGKNQARVIIVSDHGFSDFNYKVHLNCWLVDHGYLVTKGDCDSKSLQDVEWSQSQVYAVGLNSLYLNLAGREGHGCVQASQKDPLIDKLRDELLGWQGPDGKPVIQQMWRQEDVFVGPLVAYGPDIVLGYSPGYRASAQTGLGMWEKTTVEPNRDHWGADHCIDPHAVPGVLFSNQALDNFPHPSYRDIPALAIGATPEQSGSSPPLPPFSGEDEEIIEERLKSLGYL